MYNILFTHLMFNSKLRPLNADNFYQMKIWIDFQQAQIANSYVFAGDLI